MSVALMIPCYIDVFYPRVGIATLELPERLGVDVVYPKEQTCCGQPMANSGCYEETRATEEHRARIFAPLIMWLRRQAVALIISGINLLLRRTRQKQVAGQFVFIPRAIRSPISLSMLRQYSNARLSTGTDTPFLR